MSKRRDDLGAGPPRSAATGGDAGATVAAVQPDDNPALIAWKTDQQAALMRMLAERAARAGSQASEWLDELEADLGQRAALRVLANCGGQRRNIPLPRNAATSTLAGELGPQAALWLAGRFGGEELLFPSAGAREASDAAARLRADVLEAGLTDPVRSANDIARAHRCSVRRVEQIRQELRTEAGLPPQTLPLFRDL